MYQKLNKLSNLACRSDFDLKNDWDLIIIGSGPEEKNLKNLVKTLGLNSSINFTGFVTQAEIANYYAICDLYVHLAKQEPFGLTLIEAQAFGKPVITVAEGGPRENILENETGFLVDSNVEKLTNRIIQLLLDDKLRIQFGEKAKKYIKEKYDWSDSGKRFLKVCEEFNK